MLILLVSLFAYCLFCITTVLIFFLSSSPLSWCYPSVMYWNLCSWNNMHRDFRLHVPPTLIDSPSLDFACVLVVFLCFFFFFFFFFFSFGYITLTSSLLISLQQGLFLFLKVNKYLTSFLLIYVLCLQGFPSVVAWYPWYWISNKQWTFQGGLLCWLTLVSSFVCL